jgi:threonine aldolase
MIIDLRSDTVTKPTPGMLQYMIHAQVGDDVFGDDPTVNALQEKISEMFGMEAALFCPSGTMANQIAIKAHTQPMDEVICDRMAHIYNYEGGGMAFNSGVSVRLLHNERGIIQPQQIEKNINPEDIHYPKSTLVCIENTCNKGGGSCYTENEITSISDLCKKHVLKLHMDGARFFNAMIESGVKPETVGGLCDSISICLSKGLGAPVGSLLIGNKSFIKKSSRIRKVFGGGMRQAGYLAAAGIYALDHHIDRLAEDHLHAKQLGEALENTTWVKEVLPVDTNIVVFKAKKKRLQSILDFFEKHQILAVPFGVDAIRMVTHLDIKEEMIEKTINTINNFR